MIRHGLIWCGLVLVGCGGDDGGGDPAKCPTSGGENCFLLPTEAMVAHPAPMMSAAPVLGCGALVPVSSTHAVALSGKVIDYQRPTVGVANAHPDVLDFVDEVCASNDDDGVAQVLEATLAGRSPARD